MSVPRRQAPRLVFATRNRGKLEELRALIGAANLDVEVLSLDEIAAVAEVIEDRDSFVGNAAKKAEEVAAATGLAALADDSGLEVDALGGAPGVHSARYAGAGHDDAANNRKLIIALAEVPAPRTARFRCALALASTLSTGRASILAIEEGACEGQILLEPRGEHGFGYDPLFLLPHLGRTLAELPLDEKNRLSHRAAAMRKMTARLPALLQAGKR